MSCIFIYRVPKSLKLTSSQMFSTCRKQEISKQWHQASKERTEKCLFPFPYFRLPFSTLYSCICYFVSQEDFIACYDQVQGLELGNLKPNQEIKSPESSPSHLHRVEGGDTNSSANLLYGANRRRLEFKESDQIDDFPNKNQKQ